MISAGIGRYGPFVLHDGTYANLESIEDVFSIGLNRAVTVIAEKQAKGPGRGRGTPTALKTLGDHPDGGPITVRDGKYGPYVNWGKINATLPKDKDPGRGHGRGGAGADRRQGCDIRQEDQGPAKKPVAKSQAEGESQKTGGGQEARAAKAKKD
jgi:DNA topoisomerase-1